jgi:hypothetical protein
MTKEEYDRVKQQPDRSEIEREKPFVSLAEALADNRPEADFAFEVPEFKGVFRGFEFD